MKMDDLVGVHVLQPDKRLLSFVTLVPPLSMREKMYVWMRWERALKQMEEGLVQAFADKMLAQTIDPVPEFDKVISDNFFDLTEEEEG